MGTIEQNLPHQKFFLLIEFNGANSAKRLVGIVRVKGPSLLSRFSLNCAIYIYSCLTVEVVLTAHCRRTGIENIALDKVVRSG